MPTADVGAGNMVAIGELVGFANDKIPAGDLGAVDLNGVYSFAKKATDGGAYPAIEAGSKIKIDADGLAVGAEGTGTYFGFSVEPSPETLKRLK